MRIDEIITPQEKVTQTPKTWAMSDLRQQRSAALNTKTSGYFSKGFETDDPSGKRFVQKSLLSTRDRSKGVEISMFVALFDLQK
jgi:hypothetical protein